MGEHGSYHGVIAAEEAEFRLQQSGIPHCYLTRYSKDKNIYVLSVYMKGRPNNVIEHYHIGKKDDMYQIEGKMEKFDSTEELLQHYIANRISPSVPNIGECYKWEDYDARQKWVEDSAVGGHSSYHNAITAEEAMSRLKQSGHLHCYLTYFSEEFQDYFLAVYLKQMPRDVEEHFGIIMVQDKYTVEGKQQKFDNIESLLDHYAEKRLTPSLSGIGCNYTFTEYREKQESAIVNMMGEHSSYHNIITKEEATSRLQKSGQPHCYLTYFNNEEQRYMLAVYQKQRKANDVQHHYPIIVRDRMHKLDGKPEEFDSIDKLLEHYQTKRIDQSLAHIGNNYTLEAYNSKVSGCVIL